MLIAYVDIGLDGAIEDKHGSVLRLVDDMPGREVGKEAGQARWVRRRKTDGKDQDQKQSAKSHTLSQTITSARANNI